MILGIKTYFALPTIRKSHCCDTEIENPTRRDMEQFLTYRPIALPPNALCKSKYPQNPGLQTGINKIESTILKLRCVLKEDSN